jgi:capsular exopolysaccharide synthesis family protein
VQPLTPRFNPASKNGLAATDARNVPAAWAPQPESAANELQLRTLWQTLWRRRVPFLITFLSFVIIVTIMTVLQPKSYTTTVKMIAGNPDSGTAATQNNQTTELSVLNALVLQNGGQSPETFAELLHEVPVANAVIQKLHMTTTPEQLLGHVMARPVTNTPILALAVSWSDPVLSAKIANEFADAFINRERELISHQADSAVTFLQQQLPAAEERMRQAQDALAEYQRVTGIANLNAQVESSVKSLADLDAHEQAQEIDEKQATAQLASVQEQLSSTPATIQGQQSISANPVAAQLQSQVAQATVDLNEARSRYTDNHPTVVAANARLTELKRELAQQPSTVVSGTDSVPNPIAQQLLSERDHLQAMISSAQSQIVGLQAQRDRAEQGIRSLPVEAQRISQLERAAQNSQDVYQTLNHKYQDAMIARTTALSGITVTQYADPSSFTKSPSLSLNVSIGMLLGLLLGITTALGMEFFDDRMRTEEEARERTGLPVLATIPQLDTQSEKNAPWIESATIESFFELVTQLRYSSEHPPHIVTVTSPQQGDGKSTIAINIAISMASLNAKVLIIDSDLRRPTIHTKLGLVNDIGLSDVLVGVIPLDEAIRSTGHENVWAITGGMRPPNPVALLQSESFDRVLALARERFDFVILDAPALGPIVDGLIAGMKSDGTVLVISASNTDGKTTQNAISKLRSVPSLNVLGIVLNHVKIEEQSSSDYYLGSGQTMTLPSFAKK